MINPSILFRATLAFDDGAQQWLFSVRRLSQKLNFWLGTRMSRYDLTNFEWNLIEPLLPNKPRGMPRVDDRRVMNGIFWVLRSGAPWRDVPNRYRPYTTCYNRFRRWTMAGIWDSLMDDIARPSDDSIAMIDGTSVRVHHLAATLRADHQDRCLGRSLSGVTTRIHSVADGKGLPIKIAITPGHAHDLTAANELLEDLPSGVMLPPDFSPWLYKKRNLIERRFSKLKCFRRIATRYDKSDVTFLAMVKLARVRLNLRHNESTA